MRNSTVITYTYVMLLLLLLPMRLVANQPDLTKTTVKMGVTLYQPSDSERFLVLHYQNAPHWHTYWKNPGDSGLPIKVAFQLDNSPLPLSPLEWPLPTRYIEKGDIWAYGYEGEYALFFPLTNEQLKLLNQKTITIKSNWLVCKDICIPGEKSTTATVSGTPLTLSSPDHNDISSSDLAKLYQSLPQSQKFPSTLDLTLARSVNKEGLVLFYSLSNSKGKSSNNQRNILTPFPLLPFDFQHEILHKDKKGNIYGKMAIDWDGEYQEPEIPLPSDGKFKTPYTLKFIYQAPGTDQGVVVQKSFSGFDLNTAKQMQNFFSLVKPLPSPQGKVAATTESAIPAPDSPCQQVGVEMLGSISNILFYLLLAFIGGFILNFMPCVLPVISLKLFSLIKSKEMSRGKIIKHNLFYTLGILSSFLVLAIVIATLKSSGVSVGWGMQLQSPHFNIVMIIVLFIFSLNLFSLFEFRTPGGSKLGSIPDGDGVASDFLNGVLATILSTPCSAPFLGTALTFAILAPSYIIIITFLTIGLGLATPFILTAIFPSLIAFLPKPGPWMEHLKKFLGLSILLTIVWLFDILNHQIDDRFIISILLATLLFIFFSLYMQKQVKDSPLFKSLMALSSLPMLIYLLISVESATLVSDLPNTTTTGAIQHEGELEWISWSPQKMEEMQKDGIVTFVDFTAKWCFTCKVNKKLVIETDAFAGLVKKHNVKLLLADWTKRDPIIGEWLLQHGYAGVPAYFVITSKGELVPLGETISISEIEEAILK
jgi:thiol:disulfide interchange protein/DsbC/DsbD-like thiol-disulfide interchange protein